MHRKIWQLTLMLILSILFVGTASSTPGDLEILELNHDNEVCHGDALSVDVTVVNNNETANKIGKLAGNGFGKVLVGQDIVVSANSTSVYRFFFTNVQGNGEETFNILLRDREVRENSSVNIIDCPPGDSHTFPTGIDFSLNPERAFVNQLIRVTGFVDGTTGRVEVDVLLDGEEKASTLTDRDGFFATSLRTTHPGDQTITARIEDIENSRDIEVVPNAVVTGINAPEKVFVTEDFEVCANIESEIVPEVVLIRDGSVQESKNQRGNVCFNVEVEETGKKTFEIRALTFGEGSSQNIRVNVLPIQEEVRIFPSQLNSISRGGELMRVELYNMDEKTNNYTVTIDGLDSNILADTSKSTSLAKGEKESIYFYFFGDSLGDFEGTVTVEKNNEVIRTEEFKLDISEFVRSHEIRIFSIIRDFLHRIGF